MNLVVFVIKGRVVMVIVYFIIDKIKNLVIFVIIGRIVIIMV